ncbi:YLP motif-containing protein 1-like isoform X6 [Palaemon carinicauda]|uniref:YLP motif-containing protein 1-like isoform X6 n=1 Tax=Palaemon carinicauda TaxID=392227 RepID=UPI0035B5C3C0
MWSNQGWSTSAVPPGTTNSQEHMSSLQEQAQQYAAYSQQQDQHQQQWQQQAGSAANPWMWGQPGMYGMYGMYGDPSAAAAMSWMSVPPPAVASVPNTSVPPPSHNASGTAASSAPAMDAKPPAGPPPSAPPPPEDPPPPPPPDEHKEKIGAGVAATGVTSGGYSTLNNAVASNNAASGVTKFDESTDEDLKEFDRQFANWEKQFTQWQEENKNHPDKSGLKKYEEDWNKWRSDLLKKRDEMLKNKLEQFQQQNGSFSKEKPPISSGSTNDTSTKVTSNDDPKTQQQSSLQKTVDHSQENSDQVNKGGNANWPSGMQRQGANQGGQGDWMQNNWQWGQGNQSSGPRAGGYNQGFGPGPAGFGSGPPPGPGPYNQQPPGPGGFGPPQGPNTYNQGPASFNQGQGPGEFGSSQGPVGYGQGQGNFNRSQGPGGNQGNYNQETERGGFNQGPGRGGFNQGPNRGGFNSGPGQSDTESPGHKGFNQGPEQENSQGPGRGGFSQGQGRGGFNQSHVEKEEKESEGYGDDYYNQAPGRGGFKQGPDRGSFNQGTNRGGMNQGADQSDYGQGPNRDGFGPGSDGSGYNQGSNRGAYGLGSDRGGSSQGRGGFNQGAERGFQQGPGDSAYNQGPGRGGFNQKPDSDSFNQMGSDQGGFNQGPNRGGFNQGQNRGFSHGMGRGGPNQGYGGMNLGQPGPQGLGQKGFGQGMMGGHDQEPSDDQDSSNNEFEPGIGRRGGMNRGGFDSSMGRGGGRGNFGNFDDLNNDQNNFRGQSQRGRFDAPPPGMNRDESESFDDKSNQGMPVRGGFHSQRGGFGRGGFESPGFGPGGMGDRGDTGSYDEGGRGRGMPDQSGPGRGALDQSGRGRGGFEPSGRGQSNFDVGGEFGPGMRGRGGFDQAHGGVGRGFDQARGGGGRGFDQARGGGGRGFDHPPGGGGRGFDQPPGGGGRGFDQPPGVGGRGFDQSPGGGGRGFDQPPGGERGGFDQPPGGERGGFDQARGGGRGGFDQARGGGRGGFDQARGGGRGGFDQARGGVRGGFDQARGGGRGGFDQRSGPTDNWQSGSGDKWQSDEPEGMDWSNIDRWQNQDQFGDGGRGRGNMRGRGFGPDRGRGRGRGGGPGGWWDNENIPDDRNAPEWNKGLNPTWQASSKDDVPPELTTGFLSQDKGAIPGLDLPQPPTDTDKDKGKPEDKPEKKILSKPPLVSSNPDDKIDVKFGESTKLLIGPIGVPPSKDKFTLPGDWYDDDDENDKKDSDARDTGNKSDDSDKQEQKKQPMPDQFDYNEGRPGFNVPPPNQPFGRGLMGPGMRGPPPGQGLLGAGPRPSLLGGMGAGPRPGLLGAAPNQGFPFRGPPPNSGFRGPPPGPPGREAQGGPPSRWSENKLERQVMDNKPVQEEPPPIMSISELLADESSMNEDVKDEPFVVEREPLDRRRPSWNDRSDDRNAGGRPADSFNQDRWGPPIPDKRGMQMDRDREPFAKDREPFSREDQGPFGRDNRPPFGRDDRGDWGQNDRDFARGPMDSFGRGRRDNFGRDGPPDTQMEDRFGMPPRDRLFDKRRIDDSFDREPFSNDRYSLRGAFDRDPIRDDRESFGRDRRDFFDRDDNRMSFGRDDRPPFARDSFGNQSPSRPSSYDYGHGSRDDRGSSYNVDMDLERESPCREQGSIGSSLTNLSMRVNQQMPDSSRKHKPPGQEMMRAEMMRERGLRLSREDVRGPNEMRGSPFGPRPGIHPPPPLIEGRDRSPIRSRSPSRSITPKTGLRPPPPPSPKMIENKEPEVIGETVTIEDLISVPGRFMRPPKMVIILRGPPGSGKTTVAKMIKDREIENGGSPPRILSLDDYFMVETEKMVEDPDTGRKVKTKIMDYEYEPDLEDAYRLSLIKSFKKQVDDGFFPFIIIDCVNNRLEHFNEILSYGKKNSFEVYVGSLEVDMGTCMQRNTHNHSREHINRIISTWQPTPISCTKVDLTALAQDAAIEEVEMEDSITPSVDERRTGESKSAGKRTEEKKEEEEEEEEDKESFLKVYNDFIRSKWDTDETQEEKLDKLDGVRSAKKRMGEAHPKTIEDWLQLSNDYDSKVAEPGKKRVRWADVEERKKQTKARERGFILGQTDWSRMTDLSDGESALVQIRYIEGREKN